MPLNTDALRKNFPILQTEVNGRQLVYFDNAATTHKPMMVVERLRYYYENENSNIHRGAHHLSNVATEAYENARQKVQHFINAQRSHEIVFTRGTTESINLVASSFSKKFVNEGDEILISAMEHHSNIVPWQFACKERGATLKVIPMNSKGELDLDAYQEMLNEKTRIVAFTHVSNALGTVNPVKEMTAMAHEKNIPVMVDGAQAAPHLKIDVQDLDCDFYCFSGHKMYGPMGVGVFYGKEEWLNQIPPYQGGGEMIRSVTFEKTTFNEPPFKFEAGTPNVADVLGLDAAITFILDTGLDNIATHEASLHDYAVEQLQQFGNIRFIGTAEKKTSVVSFLFEDVHPYDTGTILDKLGVAVRTGHHCAQPIMDHLGIPGTVRASFALYNTQDEIDRMVDGLRKVKEMFSE